MNMNIHKVAILGCGAVALVLVLMALVFTPVPHGGAIRNQIEAGLLLENAHPEMATTGPFRVQRVKLSDTVTLTPAHEQVAMGYVFTLQVDGSTFVIEAHPSRIGKTGMWSFFRDGAGTVRVGYGEPANAESRPWRSPLPVEKKQ
jgi:hypothetical protein